MEQRKKRILFVTEFTALNTGFSTYFSYVLPRLFATDKYEIAELAVYANEFHPNIMDPPWKVYPNEPDPRNQEIQQAFRRDPTNQFGKWRLDEVCLDFRPDIICGIVDPWMQHFIPNSSYRPYFKYIHMPTVDGEPQKEEWVDEYTRVDTLLTYSYFGKHLLERQSGGQIKVFDVASPGADTEVFRPIPNKAEVRKEHLYPADSFIINTVMRNQPRKLFPDLFRAFVKFLDICKANGRNDLAAKTYLHCHTTSPDVGWAMDRAIQEHGLSGKVLMTYMCDHCKWFGVLPYCGDASRFCPNCRQKHMRLPSTAHGLTRHQLARIMGLADLYVQFSLSEGWGMCINDSKACGIPTAVCMNSAMLEQAHNGGGLPIPTIRFAQEPINQTNQMRGLPDMDYTAKLFYDFFTAPQTYRDQLGKEARKCIERYYTWDLVAKKWEAAIDATHVADHKDTWLSEPKLITGNISVPQGMNDGQFVAFCYENILRQPQMIGSDEAQKMMRALMTGHEVTYDMEGKPVFNKVDRNTVLNHMLERAKLHNHMEMHRWNKVNNIAPQVQEYVIL